MHGHDKRVDGWLKKCDVEEGAQGDCALVVRAEAPEELYFRKMLKAGASTERRRRFFTEATLFTDLAVRGIPRIVETNAHKHAEEGASLYYVAEYINGDRLDKFREGQPLDELLTRGLFRQLLDILSKIHAKDVVHRDVKPENIVVSGNELFLVDFGIAYDGSSDELTRLGDELGNRFLRLPEQGAGSANKRDVRSDVAQAVAIALYCLTRIYPRTLIDHTGAFPHQRPRASAAIHMLAHGPLWNLIFDKAFRPNLAERWSSADDVTKVLDAMCDERTTEWEQAKAVLRAHGENVDETALARLKQQLERGRSAVEHVVEATVRELAPGFRTEKQSRIWKPGDDECWSQVRAYPIGDKRYLSIEVVTRVLGSQLLGTIILGSDSAVVYRVPVDAHEQPPDVEQAVQTYLLPRLARFLGAPATTA